MNLIVGSISVALIHFLWQGLAIGLLLALALRLIPASIPRLRYATSVTALGLMVLMPIATVGYVLVRDTVTLPAPAHSSEQRPGPAPLGTLPTETEETTTPAVSITQRAPAAGPLRSGIVALWLIGVFVFTALHTGGWFELRRLRRSGRPVDDPAWEPWIADLCRRLGIRRWVAVMVSRQVDVPTVIGWFRPVVLVPTSALLGMSPQSLEALLLHELAHVRRHDFLVNLMQAAVETLLFYHPSVWWVSRQVRNEREHCCDDLAVSRCGSRLDYVQALADMEKLRLARPKLALAADGGSLVERIRRLTGSHKQQNRGGARWTFGVGIFVLSATIAGIQLASFPAANAGPAPQSKSDSGEIREDSGDPITGTWRAEFSREHVWVQLRLDDYRRFTNTLRADPAEFIGTGADGIPGFRLVRDAGTFHFDGKLDGRDRDGQFEFRGNPAYASQMRSIGFEVSTRKRKLYEMAALDVSLEFAEGTRDAGYGDISTERLVEFRIHGVTPGFVTAMQRVGFENLPPSRLVEFRIHGVSPEFIQEMRDAGFDNLSESRLVEFRIHGVTPEFVREMEQAGFDDLSASRLVEYRIHGVTPEFVREMKKIGFDNVSASRLVEFRIHGVTPSFIQDMQEAGMKDLSASRLVEFRIHGVTANFIEEMDALGFSDIRASQLVAMRIHGVSPEFARKAQERYGDDLTVERLIDMRIHGRSYDEY